MRAPRARSTIVVISALIGLLIAGSFAGNLTPQGGMVVSVGSASGGGITVSGTPAKPVIGLTPCGSGQVPVYSGTAWGCGAGGSGGGGGGITAVVAGSGAAGGGSSGSVTIAVRNGSGLIFDGSGAETFDTTTIQERITGTCTAPNAVRAIGSDGTVTCTTGTGSVTSIATTAPITGGTITTSGTIGLTTGAGITTSAGALIADIATGLTLSGNHVIADLGTGVTLSGNHIIADISTGLTLSGNHIIVDNTVEQARVTGTCTQPQAILSISSTGTVTCTTAEATTSTGTGNFLAKYSTASNVAPAIWKDDGATTTYGPHFSMGSGTGNVVDPGTFAIGQTTIAVPSAGSGLMVNDTGSGQTASHDLATVAETGTVINGTSSVFRGMYIKFADIVGGGSAATAQHVGIDIDESGVSASGSAIVTGNSIGVRVTLPSAGGKAFEAINGDVNIDSGNLNVTTGGVFSAGVFDNGNRTFSIAGTGLSSSGATASIDTTIVQETSPALVAGCGSGSAIDAISQTGGPSCVSTGGLSGGTANLLSVWSSASGITPIAVTDDTSTTGICNDYALPAGTLILRSNCSTLTGVTGGVEGRLLIIQNENATTNLSINNEAAGSTTASDRFTMASSANWVLNNNARGYATFVYNGATSRWQQIAMSPGNGATTPGSESFTNITVTTQSSAPTAIVSLALSMTGTAHIKTSGTAPTLTSCGTTPTITGNDISGTVIEGTGATGCTVTFAATYTTAPSCVVVPTALMALFSVSYTATVMTVTNTSAATFNYICMGH